MKARFCLAGILAGALAALPAARTMSAEFAAPGGAGAPAAYGYSGVAMSQRLGAGTGAYALILDGKDISATLAASCPGLLFDRSSAVVSGMPSAACDLKGVRVKGGDSTSAPTLGPPGEIAVYALTDGDESRVFAPPRPPSGDAIGATAPSGAPGPEGGAASARLTTPSPVHSMQAIGGTLAGSGPSRGWSFASNPEGLALAASGSHFSGSAPVVAARTDFAVTPTANDGATPSPASPFWVTVVPPLAATTPPPVDAVVGSRLSVVLSAASNAIGPVSWSAGRDVAASCPGLSLDAATATLSGTPTSRCALPSVRLTARDSSDDTAATTDAFSIAISDFTASANLASARQVHSGQPVAGTMTTNGAAPSWSFSSAPEPLARGISAAADGRSFTGVAPRVASPTVFSLAATASAGPLAATSRPIAVRVVPDMAVSAPASLVGVVGNPVSARVASASNAIGSVSWTMGRNVADHCPGLSFDARSATVSGTPTASCSLTGLRLSATDSSDATMAVSLPFSISVVADNAAVSLATPHLVHSGQPLGGTLSSKGDDPNWSFDSTPAGLALTASGAAFSGVAPSVGVRTAFAIVASTRGAYAPLVPVTVVPALAMSALAVPTPVVGAQTSQALGRVWNDIGAVSWGLAQNGAPVSLDYRCPGLTFDAGSATVFGTPTSGCAVVGLTLTATDSADGTSVSSAPFTILVAAAADTAVAWLTTPSTVHPGDAVAGRLSAAAPHPTWTFASAPESRTQAIRPVANGSFFSGTAPPVTSQKVFALTATEARGGRSATPVAVTVVPPLAVAAPRDVSGVVGAAVDAAPSAASNLIGAPAWTLKQDGAAIRLTALCPGLSFDAVGGHLAGVPTAACGLSHLTVTVADSADGAEATSSAFAVEVAAGTAAATLTTSPAVHAGAAVSGTLSSNGAPPAWSFGSTPEGLSLTASGATFSGRAPSVAATTSYSIAPAARSAHPKPFTVTVVPPLAVAAPRDVSGVVGAAVDAAPSAASNLIGAPAWTLKQDGAAIRLTALCPGLSFDAVGGHLAGVPTAACGLSHLTVTVADSADGAEATSSAFAVEVAADTSAATLTTSATIHAGSAVTGTVSTTEPSPAWSFSSKPRGLEMTVSGSAFSGRGPLVDERTSYRITASANRSHPRPFSVTVVPPLAASAPPGRVGVVGVPLPPTRPGVSNLIGTARWTLKRNGAGADLSSLCPGLSFNILSGQVAGVPTAACGLSHLTATVADSADGAEATSSAFAIDVAADAAAATLTTPSTVHPGAAVIGTLSTNLGAPSWSFASAPTGLALAASASAFTGRAPPVAAVTTYRIIASAFEAGASAAAAPFAVTVVPALAASPPADLSGVVGAPVSAALSTAANRIGTVTWTLKQDGVPAVLSSLCPGLSFAASSAQVTGVPTASCRLSNLTVTARDSQDNATATTPVFKIDIAADGASATLTSSAQVHPGAAVTGTLSTNEAAPSWGFVSAPPGLTLTASGTTFAGRAPPVASVTTYRVIAAASDATSTAAAPAFTMTVVPELSATAPSDLSGVVGVPVAATLSTAANRIGTVTWTLKQNGAPAALSTLCPGLDFVRSSARVTGAPTEPCRAPNLTVTAQDSSDGSTATSRTFEVGAAARATSAVLTSPTTVHAGAAVTGALSTNEGEVSWSFASAPRGLALASAGSTFSGKAPSVESGVTFLVTATGRKKAAPASATRFSVTVYPALAASAPSDMVARVGAPVARTLAATSNLIGKAIWTLKQNGSEVSLSALCPGLDFDPATARVTGAATAPCSAPRLAASVVDSSDGTTASTAAFSVRIDPVTAAATLLSAETVHPGAAVGGELATNEASPTWSFASSPSGLGLAAAGSAFSGRAPSVAARTTFSVAATATESERAAAAAPFRVTVVPPLEASAVPAVTGAVGNPVSAAPGRVANLIGATAWTLKQNGAPVPLGSLCPGLNFSTTSAAIHGTPTSPCSLANLTATATDSFDGSTATSAAFGVSVTGETASATLTSATTVHPGDAVTGTLATNEATPTWSFTSSPAGLTPTATGSTFSGAAPLVASRTTYSVTAMAAGGGSAARAAPFTVTVIPRPTPSTAASLSSAVGNLVSFAPWSGANTIGAPSWSLKRNGAQAALASLCPGLSFAPATGLVTGTPTQACSLSDLTVTVGGASDSASETSRPFSIEVRDAAASAALTSAATIHSGRGVAGTLSTNETAPSWSFTSAPAGLALTASGASFSGAAPSVSKSTTYAIAARATEGSFSVAAGVVTVTVVPSMTVTTPAVIATSVGNALPATQLATASNNIGPVTWALMGGGADLTATLGDACAGVEFSPTTGQLSAPGGHPTGACALSDLVVVATDAEDGSTATSLPFSFTASPVTASARMSAASAHSGRAVTGTLATGESAPTWALSATPATPALSLSARGASFSGTAPMVSKSTSYTVAATVTGNGSTATSAPMSVTVYPPLAASSPTDIASAVGAAFADVRIAESANAIGPVTWALMNGETNLTRTLGSACAGLAFAPKTGEVRAPAGAPTGACNLAGLTLVATDGFDGSMAASAAFSIVVAANTASARIDSPPSVHSGRTVTGTLASTLPAPLWTFETSPSAPAWAWTPSTASFTAKAPTVASSTKFTVAARASGNGAAATASFSVTVLPRIAVSPPSSVSGIAGNAMRPTTIAAASNLIGTAAWDLWYGGSNISASLGTVCPGLAFDPENAQVGAPSGSAAGACAVSGLTLVATDTADNTTATTSAFSISIAPNNASATLTTSSPVHSGHSISGTLESNKGAPTWSFESTPPGVKLAGSGAAFTGSAPAVDVRTTYSVTATANQSGVTASARPFAVTVYPPLSFSAKPHSVSVEVGSAVETQTVTASNNIGAVSYALHQEGAPASLSTLCPGLNFKNGQIYGKATAACSAPKLTVVTTDANDGSTAASPTFAIQSYINGACGSSRNMALTTIPTTNLCTGGVPSPVTLKERAWSWTCAGIDGGAAEDCAATEKMNACVLTVKTTHTGVVPWGVVGNISYTLVGGGGGSGPVAGGNGATVVGSFSPSANDTLNIVVGGGGGGGGDAAGGGGGGAAGYCGGYGVSSTYPNRSGGGGGSTALMRNGTVVEIAAGGDGGGSGGTGGTNRCILHGYTKETVPNYFGGPEYGGSYAPPYAQGGDGIVGGSGYAAGASSSGGGGGGGFGSGGGGGGRTGGYGGTKADRGQNGSDGEVGEGGLADGTGAGGGHSESAGTSGGSGGSAVLTYQAPACTL